MFSPYNRHFGPIGISKLADEKPSQGSSPCMRYFIDKDGKPITEPEEFIPEDVKYIEPGQLWETEESEMPINALDRKPTSEQLRADQLVMTKRQAMEKYSVGKTTMEKWTREYKLPNWIYPQSELKKMQSETQNGIPETLEGSRMIDSTNTDNSETCTTNLEEEEDNGWICFGRFNNGYSPCKSNRCGKNEECRVQTIEPLVVKDDPVLKNIPFAEEPEKLECFGRYDLSHGNCLCNVINKCHEASYSNVTNKTLSSEDLADAEPKWDNDDYLGLAQIRKDESILLKEDPEEGTMGEDKQPAQPWRSKIFRASKEQQNEPKINRVPSSMYTISELNDLNWQIIGENIQIILQRQFEQVRSSAMSKFVEMVEGL